MLKGMPTSFGDFSSIQVGKRIAQGGAGTIFSLSSHPGFVLKKYHQDIVFNYAEYPTKDHWSFDFQSDNYKKALLEWLQKSAYAADESSLIGAGFQTRTMVSLVKKHALKATEPPVFTSVLSDSESTNKFLVISIFPVIARLDLILNTSFVPYDSIFLILIEPAFSATADIYIYYIKKNYIN